MKLKKLEIHGFKSFADRTEIVFNDGITGIVGPNGSGKSNIGDAVRWVLGEQNARILRGAKMEDVIFGGTAHRKAANYCEVSLVFDNDDHALRSDYSEVMVTRRVYRNGDSEYYLNKSTCRLKDILELFRDTGIGREGYSLIGQGRIDEILSAKSDDRRQVFEEAAGVMTYRFRKEEAERKLQRTKENLDRVNDIIAELEGRIEPLSRQAETARVYLDLSQRLKTLEIQIFILRYDKSKVRAQELQANLEGIREALKAHEEALAQNTSERDRLSDLVTELEDGLEAARTDAQTALEEVHRLETECRSTSDRLERYGQQIEEVEAETQEQKARQENLRALSVEDGSQEEKQKQVVESEEKALLEAQTRLEAALRQSEDSEKELDAHKNEILDAVNRLSDIKNQQARAQAVHAQMAARLSELTGARQEMMAKDQRLQETLAEARTQLADVEATVRGLETQVKNETDSLTLFRKALQEKQSEAQRQHVQLETALSRLRLISEMSREMEGYNQAVKQALRFGASDPGVHDVVARLIHVPQQFETAIDMVLGGTLQNIVTDDENAAKRMIDYLRNNRLGRATFLPITTVKSRVLNADERRLLSMKGCMGVASELISYDPKYRGVVENLLGRTVIAQDLESGIAIMRAGRHAFRLVTLAGDVMHSGGSMTGGTANRTAVSLLGREREIEELKVSTAKGKKDLEAARAAIEADQRTFADRTEKLQDLQEALHQEEIALTREHEHVKNAQEELSAFQADAARTDESIAQLKAGMEDIEADLARVDTLTEEKAYDREKMDAKTEILQEALKKSRADAEAVREELQNLQARHAEAVHQLDIYGRDGRLRKAELEKVEETLERLGLRRKQLEDERLSLKDIAGAGEEALQEKNELLQKKQAKVPDLDAKRREAFEKQRECLKRGDEMHAAFEQDTQKEHRLEMNLSRVEDDLNRLCEHMFNTYDLTYAGALEIAEKREGPFELGKGEKEAGELRRQIRDMGTVNVSSIEEYAQTKERYDDLTAQRDDLMKAQEDLGQLIARLLRQMESQFTEEFAKLDAYFRVTFARLFGGGNAQLRLTDPDDALNSDIQIIAQPPGKKLQMLSLLSGGERALTAIAILFAMLKLKPTPFCILDEIEAALDEANIGYFADYLAEYKSDTQFVVVTHRKGTMERCDALYGVAMQEQGVSGMVSVDLQDYE